MSVINQNLLMTPEGYQISRSVRLRASATAYLNRTFTTPTNNLIWTWSCWVKRGVLGAAQHLMGTGTLGTGADQAGITIGADNTLYLYQTQSGSGSYEFIVQTTQVLRDPSAWYHIAVVYDSTQATSSNRIKLYLNGVQITAFSTATYPSLNLASRINAARVHDIGRYGSGVNYFDGYLTEINFIDGQALTPSSFGETDAVTGVWKPKKYAGTYGTNGFYLPFNVNYNSTYAGSFNGSNQYITVPSNANLAFSTGAMTAECWFYTTAASTYQSLIDFWPNSSGSYIVGQWQLGTDNANHLTFFLATSSTSGGNLSITSSATVLTNSWNHAALVRSGTTVTLYLNGVSVGTVSVGSNIIGYSSTTGSLGRQTNNSAYLNGYLSNARITNTAVYTAAFTPPTSALTAVTGTQLLTLQNATLVDNSANALSLTNNNSVAFSVQYPFTANIAADSSGNGNNWTPNNISLVNGVTYDSMLDTPTPYADGGNGRGNYAVLNPLAKSSGVTTANGNLSATGTSFPHNILSSIALPSSGKFYAELFSSTATNASIGIGFGVQNAAAGVNADYNAAGSYKFYASAAPYIVANGAVTAISAGYTNSANQTFKVAADVTNGKVWIGQNNTWWDSAGGITGDPSTGANPTFTVAIADFFIVAHFNSNSSFTWTANFGQRPFELTPPTGFKALNTQNLPDATIKKGNKYFDATTYTGTGSSLSVTNGGFQPDFTWIKSRSNAAYTHILQDSVRGVGNFLISASTGAEAANTQMVTSYNSNGFTVNVNGNVNASAETYVGWQWKESVSAGFDIVTYTGSLTTTGSVAINHNLGVAPKFVISKSRNPNGADNGNWNVQVPVMGADKFLFLNTTQALLDSVSTGGGSRPIPTSTQFYTTWNSGSNISGNNYVAYLFAEVAGFSKFGSYTGNGSADGPFVYLGFRPRYVLIKNASDGTAHWIVNDSARGTYNQPANALYPNISNAEDTSHPLDFYSNGFKPRSSAAHSNGSGNTIIYAAFAENPFKNSLAR